jgi:hypothetical protein
MRSKPAVADKRLTTLLMRMWKLMVWTAVCRCRCVNLSRSSTSRRKSSICSKVQAQVEERNLVLPSSELSNLESRHLCHSQSEKIIGPVQNGRVAGPKLFELSLASASPVAKLTFHNASIITLPLLSSYQEQRPPKPHLRALKAFHHTWLKATKCSCGSILSVRLLG